MVKESNDNDNENFMTFPVDENNIYQQELNLISSSFDINEIETSGICDIKNPIDYMALGDIEKLNNIKTNTDRNESDKIQKWKKHCK